VRASALVLLATTAVAHGEPVAFDPDTRPTSELPPSTGPAPGTAEAVHGAPRPGEESGRTDPVDLGDGVARRIGRGLLWIPRLPVELVVQPVRGMLYLQDRYEVLHGVISLFVTDDRKIAVFPMALFETGFGLNVGARAFFKDVLTDGNRVDLRAGFGGEFRWVARLGLDLDRRRGPVSATLEARYAMSDSARFFGYGNGDLDSVTMPVDPTTTDAAAASRFRVEVARVIPRVKLRLPADVSVTATGALVHKSFEVADPGSDVPIDQAFLVDRIPGFDGTTFTYGELEVAWDTRRKAHRWDAPGVRGTGGLALAFAGRQQSVVGDEPSFYRVGVDLQRYLRLSTGPRVLELRTYAELVTGPRDEVAFSELPRLGGVNLLRGYETDRFRDRIAVVGQVSYLWAASHWLASALFVDVGRVYPDLGAVSLDHMRVGYGIALEAYGRSSMAFRAELASSIDGGVFIYLALNPVFDARARVERY